MQDILILPSFALSELKLDALVGRKATIIEILKDKYGNIRGCWACLKGEPYLDKKEWFIPYSSFVL